MDGFPNPDPCDTEPHQDSLADAHPASNQHIFLDSHTHFDPNPLKTVVIPHML
jgi:hypothetical protein